jgi:hypothetical protein
MTRRCLVRGQRRFRFKRIDHVSRRFHGLQQQCVAGSASELSLAGLCDAMVQTNRRSSALMCRGDEAGEDRTVPLVGSEPGLAGLIARDQNERRTDGNRSAVSEPGIVGGPI